MAVNAQMLEDLYHKITDETSTRFDEGAENLAAINQALEQQVAALRNELANMRAELGLEMDRRIDRQVGMLRQEIARDAKEPSMRMMSGNLISDPRNKGIEHFSGGRLEDAKSFNQWKTNAFNYLEKFAPGSKVVLKALEHVTGTTTFEELQEHFDDVEVWSDKYTPATFDHEIKVFLTDHLDLSAAEIIEDTDSGVESWKKLTQHFEPRSHITMSNLKTRIYDMHTESAKNYSKLQDLVRELDKRIRTFKERGGKYDSEDTAATIYTMMDENLKQEARRSKIIGNEKLMREYIAAEATESRESNFAKKKPSNAMDVDALKKKEKEEEDEDEPTPPSAPPGGLDAVRVGKNQCRICLQEGHWSNECTQNQKKGKGKDGKGDKYGGKEKGKDGKGKGGKGKGQNGKGKGKGYAYGVEEQQWDGWYADDWWIKWPLEEAPREGPLWSVATRKQPAQQPSSRPTGRLSSVVEKPVPLVHDFPALAPTIDTGNPFRILMEDGQGMETDPEEVKGHIKSSEEAESGFIVSLFEDKNCFGVPNQIDTEVTHDDRTGTNLEEAGTVTKILRNEVFGGRPVKVSVDPKESIKIPIEDIIKRTLQKTMAKANAVPRSSGAGRNQEKSPKEAISVDRKCVQRMYGPVLQTTRLRIFGRLPMDCRR